MSYYYLKDDLSDVIDEYETNPAITKEQRRIWKRQGPSHAITQRMLGNTDEKSLRLLEEDGFDGNTVGSLSSKSAQRFWDYNTGHIFPPTRDLVRFGVFMHLDIYRIVALVLKGEWERFFGQDVKCWRANLGMRLSEMLPESIGQEMRDANNRFNLDTRRLYELLEEHGSIAEKAGYTADTFDSLVQEMLLSELHWAPSRSKAVADFSAVESRRIAVVRQGSPEQQQAFWLAKCSWTQLQMQVDEVHYRQECLRLQNEELNRRWLCVFGQSEFALRAQEIRIGLLGRRLLLKQANPGCTRLEIDQKLKEEEEKQLKELNELKDRVARAPALTKPSEGGESADPAAVAAYRKECTATLRRIKFLTHPDHYAGPAYQNLTEEQKNELTRLFRKVTEVDPAELGYPRNHVHHDMRSLEALQRVLEKVEAIIASAGLDVNVEYVIRGDTIAEQLEWLQRDIAYLEKDLELARSELQAMITDAEMTRKRQILEAESEHAKIKAELNRKIEELRSQGDEVEAQLDKAFEGRSEP